ncbi:hypothetical protein DIPPA_11017 [Diplonema papillatum]|nr:hypothetical protein DIPPA_11017 [Diplonema papillatum]
MPSSQIYAGLKRKGDYVTLRDGTILDPDSRIGMMYWNLVDKVADQLDTVQDILDMHNTLVHSALMSVGPMEMLSCKWTLWFDRLGPDRNVTSANMENTLLCIGTFDSVEGLLHHWNHMPIRVLEGHANLRVFRSDIVPMADSHLNFDGGRWVSKVPGTERAHIWLHLALAAIKGAYKEVVINGTVLRANAGKGPMADMVELWVNGKSPGTQAHASALADDIAFGRAKCHLHFNFQSNNPRPEGAGYMAATAILAPSEKSYRGSDNGGSGLGSANNMPPSLMSVSSGNSATYQHNPYGPSVALNHVMAMGGGSQVYPKPPGGLSGWQTNVNGAPPPIEASPPAQYGTARSPSDFSRAKSGNYLSEVRSYHEPKVEVGGIVHMVNASLLGFGEREQQSQNQWNLQHDGIPPPGHCPASVTDTQSQLMGQSTLNEEDDDDFMALDVSVASQPDKKKKRNKPDKHQRERLRKKKAKQAAIEQAMRAQAGAKCCECELYLSCIQCEECPSDRNVFCTECSALIHKIGRRTEHKALISFENPGEVPGDQHAPPWPTNPKDAPPPSADVIEAHPFLQSFGDQAGAFHAHLLEVSSYSELVAFSEADLRRVCDEFFDLHPLPALRRAKAVKDLLVYCAQSK